MSEQTPTEVQPATETPAVVDTPTEVQVEEVVTEPTFDDKVDLSASELEAIDALVSVLESDNVEKDKTISEKDAMISELNAKIAELVATKDTTLSEIQSRDEKIKEQQDAIAAIEEAWKTLQEHPQLGKLNEKLLRWETIDLSQSLIDYLESEAAAIPDTSNTTPTTPTVTKKLSASDRIRNARI